MKQAPLAGDHRGKLVAFTALLDANGCGSCESMQLNSAVLLQAMYVEPELVVLARAKPENPVGDGLNCLKELAVVVDEKGLVLSGEVDHQARRKAVRPAFEPIEHRCNFEITRDIE